MFLRDKPIKKTVTYFIKPGDFVIISILFSQPKDIDTWRQRLAGFNPVGNKASTGNPTFQVDEYDPSQSGETYAGEVAFKRKEADAEGRSEPHSRNRKSGATDLADLIFKAFTLTCFLCSDLWGALVASLRSDPPENGNF
ncbi:uncharacterized protein LACBIDRAFT_334222 [Laccaria bicolor S238N-H82]|uniref:Predicted protein n=1 Tax=Laccaria bicolor (strain S238N-H82 / ATCC MYA-4686) TaxID=486041 RepID=B0DYI3_LACBS|nr:uncharacterized protein LACBIDRAFT_334222 [Laccaria bicolor S238N-H82]EDR00442.1 predicted protein [Laccaria bicolor S238N-H82]|eukprot:XP_001889001.1 predicted protein [Laccaria bicolor S238N-H82]